MRANAPSSPAGEERRQPEGRYPAGEEMPLSVIARSLRATLSPITLGDPMTIPVSVSSTRMALLIKGFASFPLLKAPA